MSAAGLLNLFWYIFYWLIRAERGRAFTVDVKM